MLHSQSQFQGFMDSTQVRAVMKHDETNSERHSSEGDQRPALRVE